MKETEIRKLMIRIAKEHEPSPQPRFPIRQFGAMDPSALDGFRRYTVYNDEQIEKLRKRYNNEDVYVSVYSYESEDFDNCLLFSPYYIDLDSESDPELALSESRSVVELLKSLNIPDDAVRVYWSGAKGFHIEVPIDVFGWVTHRYLNLIWKTLTEMIDEYLLRNKGRKLQCIDWKIYDKRRLWHLPNSINSKTGLYKISITVSELNKLSINQIQELARQPRELPKPLAIKPQENLQSLFRKLLQRVESEPIKVSLDLKRKSEREPYKGADPPCIQFISNLRLKESEVGGRNNAAIILFSYYFNFKGYDKDEAIRIVQEWNSKNIEPMSEKELESLIKSSAEHGYNYGCQTLERYYCNRWECPLIPKEIKAFPSDVVEKAEQLKRDPELLKKFDETTDRWIVRDYPVRRLCLRAYASNFTDDPINLSLLGRDSIGKTYVAVITSKLVPENFIWFLGGLSPTALANDYGVWDRVNRCFNVDLNQRIMLFLEPPAKETLDRLKPILSHDRTEITYKVTQKTKGGQLRTITTHVKGWPVTLICAAKTGYISEYSTRWLSGTPEISTTKTKEAMLKMGEMTENPEVFKQDEDIQIWRAFFTLLAKQAPIKVKIPYAKLLAEHFNVRGPETMRVFKLFLRLIKANAALHIAQRQIDQEGYVLANYDDFVQVVGDFKPISAPTFLGVSGDALSLYNALRGRESLYFVDIDRVAKEVFGAETPESTLRDSYIKRLVEVGLLIERTDPLDKRRTIYDAPEKTVDVKVFDDEEKVKEMVKARMELDQTNSPGER